MNSRRLRVLFATAAPVCAALCLAGSAGAGGPIPQCPTIGDADGCSVLIIVNPNGTISTNFDAAVRPVDSGDDTLVGVLNESSGSLRSITLSGENIFAIGPFADDTTEDGLCSGNLENANGVIDGHYAPPAGCATTPNTSFTNGDPARLTSYPGPGTTFDVESASFGSVSFSPAGTPAGLPPNGFAYFSIEGAPSSTLIEELIPTVIAGSVPVTATEGTVFSGSVATATTPHGEGPTLFAATIDWGDGTQTAGTLGGISGQLQVGGTHTYAEEGSYPVSVTITQTADSQNSSTTTSTATVADAPLTAIGANASAAGPSYAGTVASFTDANPGSSASDFSASIDWGDGSTSPGTVEADGAAFSVAGSHTYANVGAYTISTTITDNGGANAVATGAFTVTRSPQAISFTSQPPANAVAGEQYTVAATGGQSGEPVVFTADPSSSACTVSGSTVSFVGVGTCVIDANQAGNENYDAAPQVQQAFQVTVVTLTVSVSGTQVYGGAPVFTASYSGFVNGDDASDVTGSLSCQAPASAASGVGTYQIASCGGLSAPHYYTIEYEPGSLTVGPATLVATASNASRPYGSTNPSFSVSFSGFVNGDTAANSVTGSPVCATTATASSPASAGGYPITCSPGTLASANYVFGTVAPGVLTVTRAELTVTANSASRLFGTTNPPLTATISGFVNGETPATAGVGGAAACTTTATLSSAGGTYPITCTVGSLVATNYAFTTFIPGTLTIDNSTKCLSGSHNGQLVVGPGQVVCLGPTATQNGPVDVEAGGVLDVEGATVRGPVSSNGAGALRLCGASLTGPLTVTGSTGLVLIGGDVATPGCSGNTITGPVRISANTGGVEFNGNTVTGPVTIDTNTGTLPAPDSGPVHASGNRISGPANIQ